MLVPKLFTLIKNRPEEFSREQIIKEIMSGIVVAFIAVPLSIALAIASGVKPEKGLITAAVAGFVISLLGGSRVQIGGPTGAFVVIVYGIVQKYGIDGLIIATAMAGVFLVIMGFLRFGAVIKYIPYPIVTGFTSGIAVVLFSTQINEIFGLKLVNVASDFIPKWKMYIANIGNFDPATFAVAAAATFLIAFWPKKIKLIPGTLAALIITTVVVYFFKIPVETIQTKFGELPSIFPAPEIPETTLKTAIMLLPSAATIAALAGIESLLSAVVADGMIGKRHRSNIELVAQGAANLCSSLFGGLPATGAIARTAANVNNGGRTPVSGMVHAVVVFLIMIIFMPWIKFIPMASLAAILVVVAYKMSEWRAFVSLLKAPKSDIAVLLATFFLTVFVDLVAAIETGIVLAAVLFMKRMADITKIEPLEDNLRDEDDKTEILPQKYGKNVRVYKINGPFFFGAATAFMDTMDKVGLCKTLILEMSDVPVMDATGFHSVYKIYKRCKSAKIRLIIVGAKTQPQRVMKNYDFIALLGKENMFRDLETAIESSAASAK